MTEGTPLIEVCAEVMSGVVERSTIVSLATVDSTAEGTLYMSDLGVLLYVCICTCGVIILCVVIVFASFL